MDVSDTNELVRILDAALTSDHAEVKSILQNLLVTVSLVHAEDKKLGPLTTIVKDYVELKKRMDNMVSRLSQLDDKVRILESARLYPSTNRNRSSGHSWESLTSQGHNVDWSEINYNSLSKAGRKLNDVIKKKSSLSDESPDSSKSDKLDNHYSTHNIFKRLRDTLDKLS